MLTLFRGTPDTWRTLKLSLFFLTHTCMQLINKACFSSFRNSKAWYLSYLLQAQNSSRSSAGLYTKQACWIYALREWWRRINSKKNLSDFMTTRSYLLLNIFKTEDFSWFNAPVTLWPCFPSYINTLTYMENLLCVNVEY